MRKLLGIAGISLLLQLSGIESTLLAQGPPVDFGPVIIGVDTSPAGVPNDAVVQTGYAVVTILPYPGTETTLAATTTVGFQSDAGTAHTAFAAPGLAASASIFLDVSERLGRNLGISMVNPHDVPAAVTMTIRGPNGAQLGTNTITLAARHQVTGFVTGLVPVSSRSSASSTLAISVPITEVSGTLFIESTSPISIAAVRFGGSTFSAVPVMNLGVTSSLPLMPSDIGGPNALLLPLFVQGRGWTTQIALSNPRSSPVVFRLDLFKSDGSMLTATFNGRTGTTFINFAISPGGAIHFTPRNAAGDAPF